MMDIQVDEFGGKRRRSIRSVGVTWRVLEGRWDLSKSWTTLKLMLMLRCFFVAGSKISVSDEMEFLVEPQNILAIQNEAAILNCAVESSPPADIYWIKDGATIQYDNRRYKLPNNSLLFTFIEHSSSHRPDEGLYQCAASIRSQGTIVSRKAKLKVTYINGFVQEPRSQSVYMGDMVIIFCMLDALPHPRVYWYKDNRALNTSSTYHFIHSNGALELRDVRSSDFGHYQCRAVNEAGERFSHSAQLTAQNKKVSHQMSLPEFLAVPPTEVAVVEGETVMLLCTAKGRDGNGGISRIEWLKDGSPLVITELNENQSSRWSIEGQGSLRIDNVSEGDAGQYTCRALTSNSSIETLSSLRILVPPRFLRRPSGITASVNSDVELECEVYAHPPARVEWLKNGDVVIASDYFQVIDGKNLRILGLVESDEGMYQCTATNNAGMIQASARLVISQTRTSLVNNGIPFGPVGLSLVTIAASSVTVAWHPAPLSKAQNSAHGYIVSWKEEGSRRERTLNTTFLEATVERLKSSTKYAIEVRAYNSHGLSRDTAKLHMETLHATELSLQANTLSSTSIDLSWEELQSPQEQITHYKLYYRSAEYSDEPGETDVNVVENHYTVKGLLKFHKYQFRVVAFSRSGPGKSSEEVISHTFSDVPSAAPQNITADAVSSTSIVIGWDPPPEGAQNGVIEGYKIEYRQRKDKINLNAMVEGGKRSFDFTDLEKATEYVFRVEALTVNGSGPTTAWLMKETLKHDLDETRVPEKPSSLSVRPLSDAIMVSWTPPLDHDIRIRGYVLGYGIGIPDIFRQILDQRRRHHTVKGLKPSLEYVISLKAFNYAGEGIPVYETTVTREMTTPEPHMPLMPPVGVKPLVMSSTTVMLTWSDTTLGRSQRISDNRYYMIRYNPKFQHKYRFVNTTYLSALIEDLRPDTEYEFSVTVSKGTRQSTWSLSAFNSTREAAPSTSPRDLTLVPVGGGSDAMTVNWQPPRLTNGQITGYFLYYSTDSTLPDSDWVVEDVSGDRLSTTVRDLTSDTTYYFKVQARNAMGAGPMAPTVMFRTLRADGRRDELLEASDGWGRILQSSDQTPGMDPESDGMNRIHLWIIIGCIGGSLVIILLVTMVAVVCCFCSRRHPSSRKQMSGSPKSKRMQKGLKPPDLWIHGNVELSELEHIAPDNISEVESATIGHRRKRSSNDKGGRDEDRYRSTSLRHVPLVIPVDTPPTYREPVNNPISVAYDTRSSTGNTTFPSRSQYAATPRVNIADITISNPDKEMMTSGSSSCKVLPSNPIASPQVCLPHRAPKEKPVDNFNNSSDLPNCISTEELTEEMANIEGLMKDLNNITRLHFSY